MKTCNHCGTSKPKEEFYSSDRYSDGCFPNCMECQRLISKQHRLKNLEKAKKYQKEYYQKVVKPLRRKLFKLSITGYR